MATVNSYKALQKAPIFNFSYLSTINNCKYYRHLPDNIDNNNNSNNIWCSTLLVTALMARVGDAPPDMMQSILRDSDSRLYGVDA